jgi:hypothetical protein
MPGHRSPAADHAAASALPQEPCRSPVFVLSASKSGSTLLRFILDSHPDLACPPETGVAAACAQLMHSWDILDAGADAPASGAAGAAGSPRALAAVRDWVDGSYGRYLRRRGKGRWCDKSEGAHMHAELMSRLYPEAKFICLYRHCMDVIASGVDACPWGLHRFGFDGFAAQNPGNSAAAICDYWLSTVQSMLAFEERHPDATHRVRYEDLVTAPGETAAAIFSFLGAEPVPDIARACFQTPHEANGPGDEEIWFTSGISADSMGSGVRVPVAALVPQARQNVNEVLTRLGYRKVDDEWNAVAGRIDPRAGVSRRAAASAANRSRQRSADAVARTIAERLRSRAAPQRRAASAIWPAVTGQTVALVVEGPDGEHAELRWRFARSPDCPEGPGAADNTADRPVCTIIAGAASWRALLTGAANVVTEMTAGRLRCVNRRDGHRIKSDEVHAISWLLGFTRVPLVRTPDDELAGASADRG